MKFAIIVLDSVGVGALPDAHQFSASSAYPRGDEGAHTLNHTLAATGVGLPQLERLGLGCIASVDPTLVSCVSKPQASFGRMREVSKGKDTSTGHWEFVGVQLEDPFQVFPHGFPETLMLEFSRRIGRGYLCNRSYSGTEVIRDFGEAHLATGQPIVYTSADSVFQLATHVDQVPIETLYAWCMEARVLLQGEFAVARVIARPFSGKYPFVRVNESRRDFSLEPPKNILDTLNDSGIDVVGIGKIPDIYAHRGISREIHTKDNIDGINAIIDVLKTETDGLIFCNLVDFDAKYGHRRDSQGYAQALLDFDQALSRLLSVLGPEDVLLLLSDHGNDPTWFGTDHTREHGLLLAYRPQGRGTSLGDRSTFADVAATIAEAFNLVWHGPGLSFWQSF